MVRLLVFIGLLSFVPLLSALPQGTLEVWKKSGGHETIPISQIQKVTFTASDMVFAGAGKTFPLSALPKADWRKCIYSYRSPEQHLSKLLYFYSDPTYFLPHLLSSKVPNYKLLLAINLQPSSAC